MEKQTAGARKAWLRWFETYGPERFLDAFLANVEGAVSQCRHCTRPIYVDVLIGGGVPDWSTEDGDFGCDANPDNDEEGTGGHSPVRR